MEQEEGSRDRLTKAQTSQESQKQPWGKWNTFPLKNSVLGGWLARFWLPEYLTNPKFPMAEETTAQFQNHQEAWQPWPNTKPDTTVLYSKQLLSFDLWK